LLRKIRDLKKVIVRHRDRQRLSRDNFTFELTSKRNGCGKQQKESDDTSGGGRLHA